MSPFVFYPQLLHLTQETLLVVSSPNALWLDAATVDDVVTNLNVTKGPLHLPVRLLSSVQNYRWNLPGWQSGPNLGPFKRSNRIMFRFVSNVKRSFWDGADFKWQKASGQLSEPEDGKPTKQDQREDQMFNWCLIWRLKNSLFYNFVRKGKREDTRGWESQSMST